MENKFKIFCNMCIKSGVMTGTSNIVFLNDENYVQAESHGKATYILKKPSYLLSHSQFENLLGNISEGAVQGTNILFIYANDGSDEYIDNKEVSLCFSELYLMQLLEKYKFIAAEQMDYDKNIKFVNAVYYPF